MQKSSSPKMATGCNNQTRCPTKSKARRNLFGVKQADQPGIDRFLEENLSRCRQEDALKFREKWNFDVSHEVPVSYSPFKWERLQSADVAEFYSRCHRSLNNNNNNNKTQENVPNNGQILTTAKIDILPAPSSPSEAKKCPILDSRRSEFSMINTHELCSPTCGLQQQGPLVTMTTATPQTTTTTTTTFDETPPNAASIIIMGTTTTNTSKKRPFTAAPQGSPSTISDFFPQAKKQLFCGKDRRRSDTQLVASMKNRVSTTKTNITTTTEGQKYQTL